MRCIDCAFFEEDEDCVLQYCRFLDEELLHDVMEDLPEDVACPFHEHRFDEESEYVQRGRRALEDVKQEDLWRSLKRLGV